MNIRLWPMTETLAQQLFDGFQYDKDTFQNPEKMKPYLYSFDSVRQYFEKQKRLGNVHLAVMQNDLPVGEVILKGIDHQASCCTLSIHLKNDAFKNQGIGTRAEMLALEYAFSELKMKTIYADALIKNRRSRHVLQKVGFVELKRDDQFCYYRCTKTSKCIF